MNATIFGVRIGMKIKEAQDSANNFPDCHVLFEHDKYNNDRYYLYYIQPKGKRKTLAYLIYPNPDSGVKEIILFQTALECMPSAYSRLFSCEGLDSCSELYFNFFGRPAFSKVELDVPSIHLKTTRYYYPQYALILVENVADDKTTYRLMLYDTKVTY